MNVTYIDRKDSAEVDRKSLSCIDDSNHRALTVVCRYVVWVDVVLIYKVKEC